MAARKSSRPDPPAQSKRAQSRDPAPPQGAQAVIGAMHELDTGIGLASCAAQAFERNQAVEGRLTAADAANGEALMTLQVGVKMLRQGHGDLIDAMAKAGAP